MLSFWLERRLVMPPASRERVPCCWPMVPMTIGASIPSNDPLAVWPSPAYLPTAPASAVWSRPPSSDESISDPFSISEDWPERSEERRVGKESRSGEQQRVDGRSGE